LRAQGIEFKWFFRFALALFMVLAAALWAWPSRAEPGGFGTVSAPIPMPRPTIARSVALTPHVPAPNSPVSIMPPIVGPGDPGQAPLLDRIMNVVILGDSLGDGLWAGLYRELKGDPRFNITKRSKVSTGFVRRDYFDWNAEVEKVLAEEQVDIAVIMIGTNDRQVLVDDQGHRHRLRAPGWEAAYKERIDQFTRSLKDRGVLVYWVGLPVMRSPRFGGDMRYFNSIYEERAAANGVPFIPTWNDLANASGAYQAYGPDTNGRRRLLRADDGIHFTLAGYRVLASVVADDLVRDRNAGILPGGAAPVQRSSLDVEAPLERAQVAPPILPASPSVEPEPLVASSVETKPTDVPELRPGRADDWRWPRL
jgi:uncharacterized protein